MWILAAGLQGGFGSICFFPPGGEGKEAVATGGLELKPDGVLAPIASPADRVRRLGRRALPGHIGDWQLFDHRA